MFRWEGQQNGALQASNFKVVGNGQQIDSNDHVIYNQENGRLYFDADGCGGEAMTLFATADNFAGDVPQITHQDFVLV